MSKTMDTLVKLEDELTLLRAPHIGTFSARVKKGELVERGQIVGFLRVLNKRYTLLSPQAGRVMRVDAPMLDQGVEWGATLVTLQAAEVSAGAMVAEDAGIPDLPEGAVLFEAPMDGQFYRKPSPDAPNFAEVGDILEPGSQVGLMEVMKFYYPLNWEEGTSVKVERFLVEDATPVESGQAIAVVIPQ